jgi:hypothetical protein
MRIPTPVSKEVADAASNAFAPWRPGDYDFEVHDAADDRSKSGNDMVKLTLHVFNAEGNKRTVFDYLLPDEKWQSKVRHFCESIGIESEYDQGNLDPFDMVGKQGQLKLRIKPAQGDYPANNSVADYIARNGQAKASPRPAAPKAAAPAKSPAPSWDAPRGGDLDDEIPF